jgi:hypothetical protein
MQDSAPRALRHDGSRRAVLLMLAAGFALGACATAGAASVQRTVREVRVLARDSVAFRRQADGSWVEFAHSGLPRFRFAYERDDGAATVVLDETRNVRLRIDAAARTITEDTPQGWRALYTISAVERGAPDAEGAQVSRLWFVGGGALVRDGAGWVGLSPVDGFPFAGRWRELGSDGAVIVLRDDAHGGTARIALAEGMATFSDADGETAKRTRAVDH